MRLTELLDAAERWAEERRADCEVIRKSDDFHVFNETRIVVDPAGVASALGGPVR